MNSTEELYEWFKQCSGVTTDSRDIRPGVMFFALKGERFDGNDFALQALEAGARYAVVDRPTLAGTRVGRGGRRRCIVVENVLSSLQQLAAWHRSRFDIPVIGITGTNGKTTTKELVSAVLERRFNTVSTRGNFNNHIGLPLTLLSMDGKTRMCVVEMGASNPGEIALLASLARPTCGIVTNVGHAHLEGFGSFERIKKTKGELYDFLRQSGGLVFYNADNPLLGEMLSARSGLRTLAYGVRHEGAEVLPVTMEEPFLRLRIRPDGPVAQTSLMGSYNADNVLAALCVARHFSVPEADALAAVAAYIPQNDRSQLVRTQHNVLIVDAYNANPTSMRTALDSFAASGFPDRTVILGDMLELGAVSEQEHRDIAQRAMEVAETVFLAGGEFSAASASLQADGRMRLFPDTDALRAFLQENPLSGRTILVKGSHGMHLERLRELL